MKKNSVLLTLLAAGSALAMPGHAAEAPAQNPRALLHGMSAKLASAKQFSFQAEREIDAALLGGHDFAAKAKISVHVARPSGIAARSVSRERTLSVVANGKTLTVFNETKNHYAQVPMRTTIDGLVDRLEAEYGFVPPLADFAVSNPEKEILSQSKGVRYLGSTTVPGGFLGLGRVECHRLGFSGQRADAELLIAKDDLLPRRLAATFKGGARPKLRVIFTDWKLNSPAPAGTFQFTPPKGAAKIEMWTTARMNAARKH